MKLKEALSVLNDIKSIYGSDEFELLMYDSKTDKFRNIDIGGLYIAHSVKEVDKITSVNSFITVYLRATNEHFTEKS